ncbi:MAG TPA: T9SS type A sorting domain-containing protein [Bacteroidales bacterium]|nr:T9SS type A sorting domain-containing protein [Bacteroidales bacterium]
MKKTLLSMIFTCLCVFVAYAQDNAGGTPPSFIYKNLSADIDYVQVQPPDLLQIAAEDNDRALKSEPYRVGITLPVDFTLNNSGTWTDLPDVDASLWRLTVKSEGAQSIGFGYASFYLPEGVKLFLYNNDRTKIIGAYTSLNNSENYNFSNEKVRGDEITIELYAPNDKINDILFHITDLDYFYRPEENSEIKSSGACEVNINCPEGAIWQDEKKGVCKLDIKHGSYWFNCTGSLVNNTSQNCTPYVLLADHCHYYGGAYCSTSDYSYWKFWFHYEATNCSGTSPTGTFSKLGCTLKAHDTYGQNGSGSDFCLVQISSAIASSYSVYYNGWDRNNSPSATGVSIHHPAADIMKISTYTSAVQSVTYGASGSHWRVVWAATTTNHGVTEQGSSGSPLFNSTGKIIGTLTGGGSYCSTPTEPDYYGKVYYHWDKNGSTSAKRLKDWLDPTNSGVTSLAGRGVCATGVTELNSNEEKINIYPSPANTEIVISVSSPINDLENVTVYNIMGEIVKKISSLKVNSSKATIDISALPEGVYYLTSHNGKLIFKGEFVKIK